ncbi:hypothetical protein PshuTeo1_38240 [Pseudomonas hunanensis]|nr:hypothetical protein PshuTeo1_38240 [Pseudomonas hunanensis]
MNKMNLPPLGSTVRIVKLGFDIWLEAEQFIGADCTLCAVFDTGGILGWTGWLVLIGLADAITR